MKKHTIGKLTKEELEIIQQSLSMYRQMLLNNPANIEKIALINSLKARTQLLLNKVRKH